jgi:hypothetical protein
VLTRPIVFFLRRFTIGLTPVSLGNKRTKEYPRRRCRKISAASAYSSHLIIASKQKKIELYISQLLECDRRKPVNKRSREGVPVIVTEVENFVSKGG